MTAVHHGNVSANSGRRAKTNRPLVVTSKVNPHVSELITTTAWEVLQDGGTPLDAAERATNVAELDPRDTTVGYGGSANEEGYMQLDACVMSGPDNNDAGAVAALENIKTPCSVARLVMERTDHLMLVGKGALKFARMHGFKEENLLTEGARLDWVMWKENPREQGWGYYRPPREGYDSVGGGTINVLVLNANGDMAGVTSTSGHHFKLVSRVGDSAIIGAGLYVDNDVGAAGATGHGEESMKVCASFLAVEKMREGMSPQQACNFVCQRVVDRHGGRPLFNLKIVALDKTGEYGCCSIRGVEDDGGIKGRGFCVHDSRGHRMEPGHALLPPMTEEERNSVPRR